MTDTNSKRLDKRFFRREPTLVARELLGKRLVRNINGVRLAGLIVETEAYLGVLDKAAHSYGGRRTQRTEFMYGDGGTLYVFLNYGIHRLLNIVTDTTDVPTAVLIRAVEPTEGLELIRGFRPKTRNDHDLASGPGKLGEAFQVQLAHNGIDLTHSDEWFVERMKPRRSFKIETSSRIGVEYAEEWAHKQLRFYVSGNQHVSRGR
ncbi:MAG: DNA-3-methyladenine glycosylase [Pirellulaceae bacterium]